MDKYWRKTKRSGNFRRKVKLTLKKILQEPDSESSNIDLIEQTNFLEETPNKERTDKCEEVINADDEEALNNWNVELEDDNIPDIDGSHLAELLDQSISIRNEIREWATTYGISHIALRDLLQIWHHHMPNKLLPSDPRTLLNTPRNIVVDSVGNNGHYWHQGLELCLKKGLANVTHIPQTISININVDGLPIYKSSRKEFWPILFNIFELPHIKPMVIGIYYGYGKPSDINKFLQPFVTETRSLLHKGILWDIRGREYNIPIKIRSFICDSPARAFIKGVVSFNAKHGCQKCTIIGEYSYISHCTYFPRRHCEKRTDEKFRNKQYESHYKVDTPLKQLPIDMIQDFPAADSLHLIDLGIMKKFLVGWRDGCIGTYKTKWSASDTTKVTTFLLNCTMPKEIHRAVRGLDCLAHWKGLEFRTFLYYISIVVLKEVLSSDVYKHFLLFFCAITICSSKEHFKFLNLAEMLITHFLEYFPDFYGEDYMTSNVHNLSHLVDDVRKFGELSSFNAYPFESKLYEIKNLIRHGNCPLSQVARRMAEKMDVESEKVYAPKSYPILKKSVGNVFMKLELESYTLNSETTADKWFYTKDGNIVKMIHTFKENGEIFIFGSSLNNLTVFFETPIRSSFLHIYSSGNILNYNSPKCYAVSCVKCKMVIVPSDNETVFIPLLHTFM